LKTYSFTLIDSVSPKASDIQTESKNVLEALETAIKAYDGIANPGFKKRSLRFARREVEVAA